ncbi:MAG: hypothetical protein A3H01_01075 [Candidatus Wildermuthbacteria bacterium RIFCSPLOWO2_12_FULL_40_9]|uniref:Proline--tRNA ligase n=2 Tax=Candidatus Wildermuthiibacteriota TaxID=1817923 RepID=A0A1G2RG47_9BACT|nr:MAG: hypothetical protein A3F15_00625 [Candidatus Wildermuthbacteria bacterium RIFCSPHIGHO2_12_FULL_40_12]OHA76646.1 MAG: hypothetical protein A3H01_01075 [Candidatus Wildermuthbacteria bacterium RIFCSPLOWO2_12_FULL_40_9]
MRQSILFTKTIKESPKDEKSVNARLLVRAGFVDKLMAGVYSFLPLGFLVLKKIENIIREEMNSIGGQEILMPTLQPRANWMTTGRWEKMDDLFKVKDASRKDFALGATHEEVIVPLVKKFVSSYNDLPLYVYQIQNKFRMELRAKSGLLRGKEFMMKDLYSFHLTEKDLDGYYEKVKAAYIKIFKRVGIWKKTHLTFASGGSFSKYSQEFQTISDGGEDIIFVCKNCNQAINREIFDEVKICPNCRRKDFNEEKAIEVGNIFKLMNKYSKPFDLFVLDEKGRKKEVVMGTYGIGLGRIMGTVVEVCHDEKGIIWPEEIAPFHFHLIQAGQGSKTEKIARRIYDDLQKSGFAVLYDDRKGKSLGEKLVDADLIGVPVRVLLSDRTLNANSAEVKLRSKKETELIRLPALNKFLVSRKLYV